MVNPFTPGFGTAPRVLVGRDELLGQVSRAFGEHFDPHRATWLRAARGTGKTALLNEIQDLAGLAGWVVVQEDAQTPGSWCARVADRLTLHLPAKRARRRLKSGSMSTPLGGVSMELTDSPPSPVSALLRDVLDRVLDQPSPPAGVLITVDEIHTSDRAEVAHFGNALQHLLRADRPVAAVVAGLPQVESDDLATFLTRCVKPDLERLSDDAVRVGLQRTAELEGGRFTGDALELAVEATAGYPYMLQLVGYWSWESSVGGAIGVAHVREALPRCERELTQSVLVNLGRRLSPMDRAYLGAMAVDDGPSRTAELAARLNKTPGHAGVYRHRLLGLGLIVDAGHGLVDFAIPGHRAQLRAAARMADPMPTPVRRAGGSRPR